MRTGFFEDAAAERDAAPVLWWQSWTTWLILAAVSTLPFLVTSTPPISDLYNHMGRYHVMLHIQSSEHLRQFYAFRWGVIPNLGQDLLMVPFGRLAGVERGAIILTALIPPAMILGIRELSRFAHGSVQPIALLALPFSLSFTFLFGFVNYHTGLVVVIWAAVFWHASRGRQGVMRYPLLAAFAALAWICHLSAWALLVVAVASFELAATIERHGWRVLGQLPGVALRTLPVLLPGLLRLLQQEGGQAALVIGPMRLDLKLHWLAYPLRSESIPMDLGSLALIALMPVALATLGGLRLDRGLSIYAAAVAALFCVVPSGLMGGFFADLRLLPMAWIAALCACRVVGSSSRASAIAVLAIALFVVRIDAMAAGWHERGQQLEQELLALDLVPRGARIAVMAPSRTCDTWADDGISHLAALAIVRRDAFANTEWDIPGQQLMQPIYLRGTGHNMAEPVRPSGESCQGQAASELVAELPRDRFDFVWMFRATVSEPWLKPIFRGPRGTLYAVELR